MSSYKIIRYKDEHQSAFAALNYAWIEKFFEVEEEDKKALNNPRKKILGPGGSILLVAKGDEIVGTCALIKADDETYELAKMAVDPSHQGHGLGYKLGVAILEEAKNLGAKKVFLESNSKLGPALHLYRKLGFKDSQSKDTPYERCNVQMEMLLSK